MGERASVDELNKLLSDEVAFSVFLTSLSQVKVRSPIQLISSCIYVYAYAYVYIHVCVCKYIYNNI